MEIHAVKDKKGKIVATFERKPGAAVTLEPELPRGHKVEKLQVPDDYTSKLHVIYKKGRDKSKQA